MVLQDILSSLHISSEHSLQIISRLPSPFTDQDIIKAARDILRTRAENIEDKTKK